MQKVHNHVKQLTLPQNGGNRVSKDLKFQNFPGEDAPRPPYWVTAFGGRLQSNPLS